MKTESDTNLIKGALNFLMHLFRLQESKNEYGSNLTMAKLRDYLVHINEKNMISSENKKAKSKDQNKMKVKILEQVFSKF